MEKVSIKNKKGMTLIEVILSISILSIIAITFIPIIAGSFSNIVKVGNKTKEIYDSKGKIEETLASKQSLDLGDDTLIFESARIPIKYTASNKDTQYVEGGKVVKDDLVAFVVNVPTISIEPYHIYEALPKETNIIVVKGKQISFLNGSRYMVNNEKIYPSIINQSKLEIRNYNWKNENQPYIFEVKTDSKIAKAYILVSQPRVMVVGDKNIKISSDSDNNFSYWEDRNIGQEVNLNRVEYINGKGYVSVGDNGKIFALYENSGWKSIGGDLTNKNLMDIAYGSKVLVAVDEGGTILYSDSKDNWKQANTLVLDNNLNGVCFGEFGSDKYFVVVGDSGTWLHWGLEGQIDQINWGQIEGIEKDIVENVTLFDIEAINYNYSSEGLMTMLVAVGSNGTILTGSISENGGEKINFKYVMAGSTDLKAIASNGDIDNPIIIALGDRTIIRSDNTNGRIGTDWKEIYKDNDLSFSDISYVEGKFLAVGNKKSNNRGFIITSTDGKEWTRVSDIGDFTVNSVSGY